MSEYDNQYNNQQPNYRQNYTEYYNQNGYQSQYNGYYNQSSAMPMAQINELMSKYNFVPLLIFSIIECIFFSICGVLGLIFTTQMKSNINTGNIEQIEKYHKYAKISLIVGGCIAAAMIIIYIAIFIFLFVVLSPYAGKIA